MNTIFVLVNRNRKLFFRDKGMLISALITPLILIVLYGTFLANVYKDSFRSSLPAAFAVADKLINGAVAAQLAAGLLAVSCVTVTFCVNLTMIQDRANGTRKDFNVSPVKRPVLYLGYFFATVLNSLMVNGLALICCFIYMEGMGCYLSGTDVLWLLVDIVILVLFGSSLSGIICYPLKTQGQMSAVGTVVSAGYGFLCGAYMPIANFGSGLQKVLSFIPSTYGTSLLKNHMLRGVFEEMRASGFPEEVVKGISDSLDCNPVFQGKEVTTEAMLLIMVLSTVVFMVVYLILTNRQEKNNRQKKPPSSSWNGGKLLLRFLVEFLWCSFISALHLYVPVGLLQKNLHVATFTVGIGNCVAVSILKMELLAVGIVVACFLADVQEDLFRFFLADTG